MNERRGKMRQKVRRKGGGRNDRGRKKAVRKEGGKEKVRVEGRK